MKTRIHRDLAERIREGCEGRLNIRIRPRWFAAGNIYPDCTHQRVLHMHRVDAAGKMVERMIRRFCRSSVAGGRSLSRWRSLRLGIIMHYVCDFSCYVHTPAFSGTLREHRAYEEAQGSLPAAPQKRDPFTLYGASDAAEAYALLTEALSRRENFTPAEDLDYALTAGTELAAAMLRLCMDESTPLPRRYRLPLLRRWVPHGA